MAIENLIQILQASIAPCVFISGLGLLLLSMTQRLARAVDRIRALSAILRQSPAEEIPSLREQITILSQRCHLLQKALALVALSIFFVSIIMLMLFSTLAFNIQLIFLIKLFFTVSLLCLIAALAFFLLDIRATLSSLKIEIKRDLK